MTRIGNTTVLSIGVLLAAALWCGAADGVVLTREGQPAAVIVAGGHDAQAKSLQEYLKKMTGATLPLVAAEAEVPEGQGAVVLEVVQERGEAEKALTYPQSYRLRTEGDRLLLSSPSELGLTYAVWGLLEDHLGALFLTPETEIVPQRPSLTIAPVDETQAPAFVSRRAIDERDSPWLVKNRGGGTAGLWSNHSFYSYIPESNFQTHPEWFPLINGKRQTHAAMGLCGTNAELAQEMAKSMMVQMAKISPSEFLRVGQGDGFVACQCPECRALVEAEGSEAAPYMLMLNRALEITSKQYPQHKIVTFAYYATLAPPKTMRPHPNLAICVVSTSLRGNCDQLGPIRDNPANADCREAAANWPKIAPGRVGVWHWSVNFRSLACEWPNLFSMCDNFKLWHEYGVSAAHTEMSPGNWHYLRKWLFTKMMWNPDADAAALMRKFLDAYYGPKAGPLLYDYIRYASEAAEQSGLKASGLTDSNVLRKAVFTDERLAEMTRRMDAALEAAKADTDPAYADRVTLAMGTSVDLPNLLQADGSLAPFARVADPRDGRMWLVPGGKPDLPARIERISQAYRALNMMEWAGGWFSGVRFMGYAGGPLEQAESDTLKLEVLPHIGGQITSLVYKPTGAELLAWEADPKPLLAYVPSRYGFGYGDALQTSAQVWTTAPPAEGGTLAMTGELHRDTWWNATEIKANQQLRRTLTLEPDAPALTLTRTFVGNKIPDYARSCALPNPFRFSSVWRLAAPGPGVVSLRVSGGGLEQTVPLGSGEKMELKLPQATGDLVLTLNRGDGLYVTLTTPAGGWEGVTVQPVPGKKLVSITLTGLPHEMGQQARAFDDLPAQRLAVVPAPQ